MPLSEASARNRLPPKTDAAARAAQRHAMRGFCHAARARQVCSASCHFASTPLRWLFDFSPPPGAAVITACRAAPPPASVLSQLRLRAEFLPRFHGALPTR